MSVLVFVIYQALPASSAPGRNNQLIFRDIGYWFPVNMILNGLWLIIFTQKDTKFKFVLGFLDLVALLVTNLVIMFYSTSVKVTTIEAIFIRGTFTIYGGWILAACAVNAGFVAKKALLDKVANDH